MSREYKFNGDPDRLNVFDRSRYNHDKNKLLTNAEDRRRRFLEDLGIDEIEPGESIRNVEGKLIKLLQSEWAEHTTESVPEVEVFYIPKEKWLETTTSIGAKYSDGDLGVFFYNAGVVVVLLENDQLVTSTTHALAHELAHAFSNNKVIIHQSSRTIREAIKGLPVIKYGHAIHGMILTNRKEETFGPALEEYYAVEKSFKLSALVTSDYPSLREEQGLINSIKTELIAGGAIKEADVDITDICTYSFDGHTTFGITQEHAYKSMRNMFKRIDGGWALLEQARVSGDFSGLSKLVNSVYGPGAFQVIMKCGLDVQSTTCLTAYLESENPITKKVMAEIIDALHKNRKPVLDSKLGVVD